MIELQRYLTHLPSHDEQPPASFGWNADCQVSFDHGVQTAQAWLDNPNSGWLWANLLMERQLYPPGAQRHAFELGFLSRIHQRLCSPLGGEHQALRTELRL
ncbi:LasR-specific antiactivator QslA [Pseudomonas sp. AA-38]|uniref:LasR-specific antiactivator QslA n=1 Tax=Pseudomonas sp. AA-38 TaxID=3028807 RepID=UPI0023FA088A|nr:LasR-specific antiactivator QslA [Pseudomonas sp. AA-38]